MLMKYGTARQLIEMLFEAEPGPHPDVMDAYLKAVRVLRRHSIPFRVAGGMAMSLLKAGRPTKDIDFIVPRASWHKAREALNTIATDLSGIYFGLQDEPKSGLAVLGPHGVAIEVWPEGTTHGEIARIRGKERKHPAGDVCFTMRGDSTVALINSKLASFLSASDRIRDAADVEALIKKLKLTASFSRKLAPTVRDAYLKIWSGEFGR